MRLRRFLSTPAIDPFGDLYINRAAEHTGRHNGALDAWTDGLKRAFRSPCRVVPNPEYCLVKFFKLSL